MVIYIHLTLSHGSGGRDGFRTALGYHDSPYLTPVQLGNITLSGSQQARKKQLTVASA
jgi:hypothetical protein